MWDELASRVVSYVGGSALVITSIQAGDATHHVEELLAEGADVVSHGGNLMRLRFIDWPPITEVLGHLSVGDVFGFIGACAVLYRLWLDIRKSRGDK